MKNILLLAITFVLFSCGNKNSDQVVLKESTGKMNSLLIVMDSNEWQGKAGDALREIIASPVLGLPQEESQFTVNQIPPKTFGSLFKANRNILFVGVGKKDNFYENENVYSAPQTTLTILGKDETSLIKQIQDHKKELISVFRNSEIEFHKERLTKKTIDNSDIKLFKKEGFSFKIPEDYSVDHNEEDFLWIQKYFHNKHNEIIMNIIAYSFPITTNDENAIENAITSNRDSIGKKHIPGKVDGSYMVTEAAYSPHIKKIKLANLPAFEARGTWEIINGQYMAGPFVNYTIIDKEKNKLYVIEGFTFAPNIKKRDYMFELEAILKTLEIKN